MKMSRWLGMAWLGLMLVGCGEGKLIGHRGDDLSRQACALKGNCTKCFKGEMGSLFGTASATSENCVHVGDWKKKAAEACNKAGLELTAFQAREACKCELGSEDFFSYVHYECCPEVMDPACIADDPNTPVNEDTCGPGMACVDGKCLQSGKCVADDPQTQLINEDNCGPDLICDDGKCIPRCIPDDPKTQLINEDTCQPDMVCDDGKCSSPCTEYDGGDIFKAGKACKGNDCVPDFCQDDKKLMETICHNNEVVGNLVTCDAGCQNGACLPGPVVCTDTDGGDNIFKKGTACEGQKCATDFCLDDKCLVENHCAGGSVGGGKVVCPNGCVDGACIQPGCVDPLITCDGGCIDPTFDNQHCGGCNMPCNNGSTCQFGSCQCLPGESECNGLCVNMQHDPSHCGGCNNPCAPGQACVNGSCSLPGCIDPLIACDGSCVDPTVDDNHCGGCNTACAPGQACIGSVCETLK